MSQDWILLAREWHTRRKAEEWGVNPGALIHPVRLAVSGATVGPGLFELLEFLGEREVGERLGTAVDRAI